MIPMDYKVFATYSLFFELLRPGRRLKGQPAAKHWHLSLFRRFTKLAGTLLGR